MEFPFHIDNTDIPIVISHNMLPWFTTFRAKVAALRNLVRIQRTLLETSYNESLIKEYEDNRCANYAVNKATFIASSLNRSKRAIVLDRAMFTNANNETILETDPVKVKELTNNYFRTITGTPTKAPPTIDEMTEEWQLAYLPDDNIDQSIYNNLLSHQQMMSGMLWLKRSHTTRLLDSQEYHMSSSNSSHQKLHNT